MNSLLSIYGAFWLFVIFMVSTPGPANMLLMAAGAQNGFRAMFPFQAGLVCGKIILNIAIGLGLMTLLAHNETAYFVLALISAAYMAYLALRGWHNSPAQEAGQAIMGFRAGLFVHPLSPKAWVMSSLAYSQFAINFDDGFASYVIVPLSFAVAQIIFHSLWCWSGAVLGKKIHNSQTLNRGLILLTLAVVIWALFQ